jgi:hypothetical protein
VTVAVREGELSGVRLPSDVCVPKSAGGEGEILPLADYGSLPLSAIAKTTFLKGLFD